MDWCWFNWCKDNKYSAFNYVVFPHTLSPILSNRQFDKLKRRWCRNNTGLNNPHVFSCFFLKLTNWIISFNKENVINFHTLINLLLIASRVALPESQKAPNLYTKSQSGCTPVILIRFIPSEAIPITLEINSHAPLFSHSLFHSIQPKKNIPDGWPNAHCDASFNNKVDHFSFRLNAFLFVNDKAAEQWLFETVDNKVSPAGQRIVLFFYFFVGHHIEVRWACPLPCHLTLHGRDEKTLLLSPFFLNTHLWGFGLTCKQSTQVNKVYMDLVISLFWKSETQLQSCSVIHVRAHTQKQTHCVVVARQLI